MITPDCKIEEVSEEQETEKKSKRLWDGCSLQVPEYWEHKKFRLTMTFPDIFTEHDPLNPLATYIFRNLKHPRGIPDDALCGTVFISNENGDEFLDFTMEDLKYIMKRIT